MPNRKTTTLKPIFNTEMKHLSKLSDEELVVLYSEGNNKAFDILLTRYKNRIYSYIFYTVRIMISQKTYSKKRL